MVIKSNGVMKEKLILLAAFVLLCTACKKGASIDNEDGRPDVVTFRPERDEVSLVRNPLMGWTLYDDANDYVANAAEYWNAQDHAATNYASIFYIRWRWSELEPEEGKYAWDHNENFKALVKGALDRGLKLAFCIYSDGQDNIYNGTPDFVREAGAEGYGSRRLWQPESDLSNWTPYADDPVFREKLTNFVKAFAAAFDDPDRVDYIDGYTLGWWGEGHHVKYKDPANKGPVFEWFVNLYGDSFKNVPLVIPFGTEMGLDYEQVVAMERQGFLIRRNGLGSTWFQDAEVNFIHSVFPRIAFIAESCYWGCFADNCRPWASDPLYGSVYRSWKDVYTQTYQDAIRGRANTLDLREAVETRGWLLNGKDLVEDFVKNGGYRLYPVRVEVPETVRSGETMTVEHEWENGGTGVCPNNNVRWNYKYRVALAWIDAASDEVKQVAVDGKSDPSAWVKGKPTSYALRVPLQVPPGNYRLGLAIVDTTKDNTPALNLAVKNASTIDGWLVLGDVSVQ